MADSKPEPEQARTRVLALLARHGWNTTSFQVLEPGNRYWFGDDACVAYVEAGHVWVTSGAPIAARERLAEVADAFIAAAREAGRKAVFFGVEAPFVEAATNLVGFKIGEQPVWDPQTWSNTLRSSRSLREQLRRARAKNVTVRVVDSAELGPGTALREAVTTLVERWLASRPMAPMGFLVNIEPFAFATHRRYFIAEREGRVVGFLAAVPIYGRAGWFFEDLLRVPEAPNGTVELLVDFGMTTVAQDGARFATLGMVPLAGVGGRLAWIRDHARALYDFGGLDAFKQKLKPVAREPIHVVHARDIGAFRSVLAVLTAFARGSLLRFGVATLARGGPNMLRLLGGLLVPWTALLALAAPRLFPSDVVRVAWVAFNALLACLLFVLARHYRLSLGRVVVALATIAGVATWAHAIWVVPRLVGPLELIALLLGCLAPACGTTIAIGALRRYRRLQPLH